MYFHAKKNLTAKISGTMCTFMRYGIRQCALKTEAWPVLVFATIVLMIVVKGLTSDGSMLMTNPMYL